MDLKTVHVLTWYLLRRQTSDHVEKETTKRRLVENVSLPHKMKVTFCSVLFDGDVKENKGQYESFISNRSMLFWPSDSLYPVYSTVGNQVAVMEAGAVVI